MTALTLPGTPLTEQERTIIRCVSAGMINKQIGRELGISANTVKSHLRRIFQKTGAVSRANLIGLTEAEVRYRAPTHVAAMLQQLRDDRAAIEYRLGTSDWYRQEGELRVLDRLIGQIGATPYVRPLEAVS